MIRSINLIVYKDIPKEGHEQLCVGLYMFSFENGDFTASCLFKVLSPFITMITMSNPESD